MVPMQIKSMLCFLMDYVYTYRNRSTSKRSDNSTIKHQQLYRWRLQNLSLRQSVGRSASFLEQGDSLLSQVGCMPCATRYRDTP